MQWSDQAIIINVKRFNENSAIIHLLTQNHGLHKGMVRNLASKNSMATYQIGNMVHASWNARLPQHLGNFSLELTKQIIGHVINDQLKLLSLQAACSIIDDSLVERQSEPQIFLDALDFLDNLRISKDFLIAYNFFELNLLSSLGFGLDLSQCTVTGSFEDLIYVSPKTAKAVTRSVGEGYHDKLLQLPSYLINEVEDVSKKDLIKGLKLTGYFLYKHCYYEKNTILPSSRTKILSILQDFLVDKL